MKLNITVHQMQTNLQVNSTIFFFSYTTCIAFSHKGKLTISENIWSAATGKHLNKIDADKSIRIPNNEFNQALEALEV